MSNSNNKVRIAVIIVNYKTAALVCRALDSLAQERQRLPGLCVVIVDNDSPDDSHQHLYQHIIRADYKKWATLLRAERNGGYAYGNNLGFSHFEKKDPPDYYWLLNPDTYLRSGAGTQLVEHLKNTPDAIAGSRLEDEDATVQVSTFNFPSAISETLSGFALGVFDRLFARHRIVREVSNNNEKVDWIAGASMMIPRKIFERVGPMDDAYFLYFEEVDYCLQIHRAGFDCWYVPSSRVVHEVGAATGISDTRKIQPRRPAYWFDSRRRYFIKNHGYAKLLIGDIGWMCGYALWCTRKYLTRSEDLAKQPPHLLRDFFSHSLLNPLVWGKRI